MAIERKHGLAGLAHRISGAARAAVMAAATLALAACAGGAQQGSSAGRTQSLPSLQSATGGGGKVDASGRATAALLVPLGDARPQIKKLAQSLANAAQLAQSDLPDQSLQLKIYDTKGTPAGAAAAATLAAQEGATVILGPLFAQSVAAAAPVARTAGLSVIAFSTDDSVAGGNVFLIGLLPQTEVERVVAYAAQQGISNYGALAPQNRLGDVTLQAMRAAVLKNGGRLSLEQRYVQDFQGIEEGVRAYADQHKSSSNLDPIQSVLLADQGQALQSVAAYLAYFDVSPSNVKFIGPGGWNSSETLRETALRGGWFAAPDPRLQQQFGFRYEQAYGEQPHQLASLGFDAMAAAGAMLADARARNEAYPFTPQAITAPAGFQGVNGVVRFLPNGLNERGLAVLEVGPEGFSVIDPAPLSFAGY